MDDINYLRYRNIQLETELRLVKEQLSQAQSGTQYLINCLSKLQPHPGTQNATPARTETRHLLAHGHNLHDRSALNATYTARDGLTSNSTLDISSTEYLNSTHFDHIHQSDAANFLGNGSSGSKDVDLLGLDNYDSSPSADTKSSGTPSSNQSKILDGSLIDSPIDTPLTPFTPSHREQDTATPRQQEEPRGLGISCSTAENLGEWQVCRSPAPKEPVLIFSRPFSNSEHNRLMGSALFVEDMSAEDQTEHWKEIAWKDRRHSAEEWKLYYDRVIRPVYLEKVGARVTRLKGDGGVVDTDLVEAAERGHEVGREVIDKQRLGDSMWIPRPDSPLTQLRVERDSHNAPSPTITAAVSPSNTVAEKVFLVTVDHTKTCELSHSLLEGSKMRMEDEPLQDKQLVTSAISLPQPEDRNISSGGSSIQNHGESNPTIAKCELHNEHTDSSPSSLAKSPIPPNGTRASPPARLFRPRSQRPDILYNIDSTDETVFHTVVISNVPREITLSEILSRVRGGKIISATFLETAGMKTLPPTTTNAAMIVFVTSDRAKAFVDFCQDHPILFGSKQQQTESNVKAQVTLLRTPTRPIDPKLLLDLQHGLTRVLFIIDEKQRLNVEEVVEVFTDCGIRRPIHFGRDEDGTLFFEFADVRDAGGAWRAVERCHWVFGEVGKGFLGDPCARAFEKGDGEAGVV